MGSRRATKARVITLSVDERAYLDRLVRRRKVGRGDAQRAENACSRPLRWTKSADDILASIDRFCRRTLEVHAQSG